MATPRVLVLRAPGTNCDEETQYAFELAGGLSERLHVNRLLEAPNCLDAFQILCIPGGFSYGDDIAAGKIFANVLRLQIGDALRSFIERGRLILGICNGFQVLLKTGLLLEAEPETGQPRATLAFNRQGRFEDRWIHVKVTTDKCVFVESDEILAMPIAHAEGSFAVSDDSVLEGLIATGRVAACYVDRAGNPGRFPVNPNGSAGNVAGICDATGRVFGLMPHPERHIIPQHHPSWTRRREQPGEGDGLRLFKRAVNYFS